MKATGAQLLAKVLSGTGIKWIAGQPGLSTYEFVDAIAGEKSITPLLTRNEALGAFAADVYYRLSGELMAVTTHTLPGTANVAAAVGNAYADSSAMLIIAGETARDATGRGAYQELSRAADSDVPNFLRHLTKKSWIAHNPLQLVEQAYRAMKIAKLGRPGPVALHVYQDVWEQEVDIPDWPSGDGFDVTNAFRPDAGDIDRAAMLLRSAQRPLIVAGNGINLGRAQASLLQLAEHLNVPVATTTTGKGAFPEDHPMSLGVIGWVGTSVANMAGREADVILAIGARMTETATSSWQPRASFNFGRSKLIQCDVDPAEIANVIPVHIALVGDARRSLDDLMAATDPVPPRSKWSATLTSAKREWAKVVATSLASTGAPMSVGPVVRALREATRGRPVSIVGDIGKHHKWLVQQFECLAGDAVVSSMGAATMGIGPCGAVGAALARPEARTVAWTGDGGMSMVPYVLPTVAEYNLPVLFVVIDDGRLGAVANSQEQRFGRTTLTEFNGAGTNPGYRLELDRVAEGCGVPARRIEKDVELDSAFTWAQAQEGPALLDIIVDPKSTAPGGGGSKLIDLWNHPVHPWAKPS